MTVEELKQKKLEMEKAVAQIVSTFMAKTGVVSMDLKLRSRKRPWGCPPRSSIGFHLLSKLK